MLVVIGIVAVVIALLLPAIAKVRSAHRQSACLGTLRQIATAFQLYAADNGSRYPDPATSNRSWEQMLLVYYRGGTYACPSDVELAPALGSSYDWRDTGDPATTMAGRSVADLRRTESVLAFEALPGWHRKLRVNVIRLDSAAETIDDQALIADLRQPLTRTTTRPTPGMGTVPAPRHNARGRRE